MTQTPVILFGDQTVETLTTIRSLIDRSSKSALLKKFLDDATKVVKSQVQSLNLEAQSRFFGFSNLLDLAERFGTLGHPDDLVATVLMAIAQLGELILHAQIESSILNNPKAVVVGLCTGVLPAVVAAVSRGLDDVLDLGIKVICLAFQLAVDSGRRSEAIEAGAGHWGFSILNVPIDSLESIIEKFHAEKGIPTHRHAYLSVVSEGWATASGPPSTLQELFAYSDVLSNAPKLRLPFGAAAHAPHLPPLDMEALLDASGISSEPIASRSQLISTSTARPYPAGTLRQLLRGALDDIIQAQLRLNGTVQGILAEIPKTEKGVRLIPVGPLGHTSMVQRALQRAGKTVELVQLPSLDKPTSPRADSEHIAIVGMSGRFPGSENIAEFWQSLLDQKEFHTKIPSSRFDIDSHFDADGKVKNATSVPYGNFLENPGLFDHRMFKVSPREALQMDPLQRLSLMCAYEALEQAGYSPERTMSTQSNRIATFFGQACDDYRDTQINEGVDVYFVPALQRAFVPGRLHYHFGWGGPTYSVDSACASSLSAVTLGMMNLLNNKCDTALAGGGSLLSNPAVYAGLSRGSFLSTTGSCKTFQDSADGYCRGEGVGVVVMKRLEDALAENDNVLAIIRGAVRNSSSDSISITHPSTTSQQALYRSLLSQINVTPEEVGFVEMHGTATQAGDLAEMNGVAAIFGGNRAADNPLYVGAVKANIGHGEASAGLASLIKSILILREKKIPGQPIPAGGRFVFNHNYPNLPSLGIRVAEQHQAFRVPKPGGKRKLLLNNFDAAGGNVSLILEEYPEGRAAGSGSQDPRKYHVVAVSGHTAGSYTGNKKALLEFLRRKPETSLADLAYSTTARRIHHPYRIAYAVDSISKLQDSLAQDNDVSYRSDSKAHIKPNVVFAFTGQGSKARTFGARLYQTSRSFKRSIDSYERLAKGYGFDSFLPIISGELSEDVAATTVQTQLATVAVELALVTLWEEYGIRPTHVIGHSLGEYAALAAAGVLSIDDTLYLVGTRAKLLQDGAERNTHAMLAVGLPKDQIAEKLSALTTCEVACVNTPSSTVISGPIEEVEELKAFLKTVGVSATQLDTPYAFHSKQVDVIVPEFVSRAKRVRFNQPSIPVASTVKGAIVTEQGTFDAAYLGRQAREPVDFVGALNALRSIDDETTLWIEIGPTPVSLGLIKSTLDVPQSRLLPSLQAGQDDWKVLSATLAALHTKHHTINWTHFHQENIANLKLLDLPAYAFELRDFWQPFVQHTALPAHEDAVPTSTLEKGIRSLLNSSLQSLVEEKIADGKNIFIFSSSTTEPNLSAAMKGHVVDGHAICPTSVFLDMALSAARYVALREDPSAKSPEFSVYNLDISAPLVLAGSDDQMVFVTATQRSSSKDTFTVTFASQSRKSRNLEHGKCTVQLADGQAWKASWRKNNSLVKLAKQGLLDSKDNHHLSRPIVYKLFSQLVQYNERYQAISKVTISDDFFRGVSSITLDAESDGSNFLFSPYWLDALVHLAGFQVNSNPAKPDSVLWVSTGFETLSLLRGEFMAGKEYTNFIVLNPPEPGHEDSIMGEAYIFDGETTIGIVSGISFHRLERSQFAALVRSAGGASAAAPASTKPTAAKPPVNSQAEASEPAHISFATAVAENDDGPSAADELEAILATIAKETGVDRSEINDSTVFADLGVDSLMSITISDVLQKDYGITVPSAFLQENHSVAEVRKALGQPEADDAQTDASWEKDVFSSSDEGCEGIETPATPYQTDSLAHVTFDEKDIVIEEKTKSNAAPQVDLTAYESRAVLIHGRKRSKEIPLFLITDGAGSAAAYLHLPSLPKGRPVYALESPFLQDPSAFTCTVEEVATLYLAALRKVQPQGPYLLGGWSAGAVFSYEVSVRLLDAGETILGLIMLDMRVPVPLTHLPEISMELLEASGMTAGINRSQGGSQIMGPMPLRLKQHLLSVCRALVKYEPRAMTSQRRPNHVYMIWARLGLSEVMDDKPADETVQIDEITKKWFFGGGEGSGNAMQNAGAGMMGWFYEKRKTFGSNGWQDLVGQELKTWVVDADHFSMVAMPTAIATGGHIREAVDEATAFA
ncbi:polyketide synthase [Diplocarpon mali]|nr:polyketide synthase [Diplocarpon mali]